MKVAILNQFDSYRKIALLRVQAMHHPEWSVWLLSISLWLFFLLGGMDTLHSVPLGENRLFAIIILSLWPWVIMVIAMMYPLLNEPMRHVAFSVSSAKRPSTIIAFLIGYTTFWVLVGIAMIGGYTYYQAHPLGSIPVVLIGALVFLLAGALVWWPGRRKLLTACSITVPIHFNSWKTYSDATSYGWTMGKACFKTCWPQMFALVLCHHNVWLMALVTIGMLYERYRLPHKSRKISYYWIAIGLVLAIFTWQNMSGASDIVICRS